MTTFTNSEGPIITHTNEFLDTISLQLNSSSTYYTAGEHGIIVIITGSNKHGFWSLHTILIYMYCIIIRQMEIRLIIVIPNLYCMELQTNTIYNQFIMIMVLLE